MTTETGTAARDTEGGVQGTQALRKGIALLEMVASRPMRFTELSEVSGLPRATLHRLLSTLIEMGLLRLDRATQTYRLGVRLFEMAHHVWDEFDLRGAAEPELNRLWEMTGESVRLAILSQKDVLYIDERISGQTIRLAGGIGERVPVYATAAGKAILGHLSPAERADLVASLEPERLTPNTITNRDALLAELDLVKGRGYAVSIEENRPGISSVSAPILDHRARAIGAITVVIPAFRTSPGDLHALGREVIETCRRISGNAGEAAMSLQVRDRPLGADRPERRPR